jgi:hypothetical protein
MWKIVRAGPALFLLNKGGDIAMGGEKHDALPLFLMALVSPAARA